MYLFERGVIMDLIMNEDDIVVAQRLVTGSYNPLRDDFYHEASIIYKTTNEDVRSYLNLLKDKEKIFSITASGDQILNSILVGSKDITACDVSHFPNYFLALKVAAVKSLSLEDYLNFFVMTDEENMEFSDKYYDELRSNLDKNSLEFWDHLFGFFDGNEIYNSSLFSREVYTLKHFKERNPYLEEENYKLLRKRLHDTTIRYVNANLGNSDLSFNESYDLVNLSSIMYYGTLRNPKNYLKLLESFNLNDKGMILSYVYDISKQFRKNYGSDEFKFQKFNDDNAGVMVYQKTK